MTISQIAAIIGLLLSFGVPQPKADEVYTILMNSQKIPSTVEAAITPEEKAKEPVQSTYGKQKLPEANCSYADETGVHSIPCNQ